MHVADALRNGERRRPGTAVPILIITAGTLDSHGTAVRIREAYNRRVTASDDLEPNLRRSPSSLMSDRANAQPLS
jgi:hypothetical protein